MALLQHCPNLAELNKRRCPPASQLPKYFVKKHLESQQVPIETQN